MTAYFVRRILLIIPTFLGITLAVFAVMHFVPGGPVERLALPRSGHVATLGPDLDLLVDAVHRRCD